MNALNRKLVRDLSRSRGQVFSIALVVAAGIMCAVTMQSTFHSLVAARDSYYAHSRFGHVFASLTRAPNPLGARLAAIPGVLSAQTRVKLNVVLNVPGLELGAGAAGVGSRECAAAAQHAAPGEWPLPVARCHG